MDRTYTTQKLAVFALTLLFTVISIAAAQDPENPAFQPPSGMSGKVVDAEGNPVAGFTFTIRPMKLRRGLLQPEDDFMPRLQMPPEGMEAPGMPRTTTKVQTDPDGTFTVANIQPGLVQLNAVSSDMLDAFEKIDPEKIREGAEVPPEFMRLGQLEPDKKILSLQVGKVTFFYNMEEPHFFEGLTFALKPGVTLENLKITVKSRLQIRGRIVYADGTPLVNANGRLRTRQRDETNPNSGGSSHTDFFTDADGYFTEYRDEPGFYTLSAEYNGLSGGAGPFLFKEGVAPENLVITLDGNPPDVERPTDEKVGVGGPIEKGKVPAGAGNIVVEEVEVPPKVSARAVVPPQAPKPPKSVWVINPANGHAYKKIQCQDWHDAQQKAVEEEAHLVSINDEDEQHWLQVIFRSHSTWIGLTDVEKEGTWQWDSGEPVTYTNWAAQPIFPDGRPETEKDYVVITFRDGEWESISPESHFWRMTREAIIEKDGLVSTAPVVGTSDEE